MPTVAIVALFAHAGGVRADAFDAYQLTERFELPVGGSFDTLIDGRIVTVLGNGLYVESAVGTREFIVAGTLDGADIASFGPAFVRVSPDGAYVAIGNNGGASFDHFEVGVFNLATLSGAWLSANHFDAEWIDDRYLAITSGDFTNPSIVTALDTQSPDPLNPSNVIIIENVGGASGGVALDAQGNLFTGNGFTFSGPSGTGAMRAFPPGEWQAALSGGLPADFENDGVLIVDILSASPLGFDAEGNLYVGGGDFGGTDDSDFLAIVRHSAVQSALGGSGAVDPADPANVRRLDPDSSNEFNFYTAVFNAATGELYVADAGSPSVFVYTPDAPVPAASMWGLITLALATCIAGTLRVRGLHQKGRASIRDERTMR